MTAAGAGAPAYAQHDGGAAGPVPVVDTFEDGDTRLKLVGLPAPDGFGMSVTLVYEEAERRVVRSITVHPDLVEADEAESFNEFVSLMDPDFVSFVRALLADRILHLRAEPSALDVAEAGLFFRRKLGDLRQARLMSETEGEQTAE